MRLRRTRDRTQPVPVELSTEHTLTVHVAVDVLGRELHTDRWGAVERAANRAAVMVRDQLDAVSTYDEGGL